MLKKAFQLLADLYRWHRAPSELRDECNSNLLRMQTKRASSVKPNLVAMNGAAESGIKTNRKVVSLFESMPRAVKVERKAVGHWCTQSAAAAREERLTKIERSYESDFRAATAGNVEHLDVYLALNSKAAALKTYIKGVNSRFDASDASLDEVGHKQLTTSDRAEEILFTLAQNHDATVRMSVASNENASGAILWTLTDDESDEVRLSLLENPKLPVSILEKLTNDVDGRVKRKAQSLLRKLAAAETGIAFGNLGESSAMEIAEVRSIAS